MKKILTAAAIAASVNSVDAQVKPIDPAIESHTKAFLKILNSGDGKPMEQLSPADARKVLEGAQTSVATDVSGIEVAEKTVSGVKLYIVRPSGQTGVLPAFHPTALNECYTATKWVAENGAEINVDGKRIAVVGNSVGGNLAAATVLMAKDKKGPEIKFQLLFWPVTNADFETVSYKQYASSRFLTKNMMIWFWGNYIAHPAQRKEIYASPMLASADQLKGLPSTLVQTAENDVLRDEGEAYARKFAGQVVAQDTTKRYTKVPVG